MLKFEVGKLYKARSNEIFKVVEVNEVYILANSVKSLKSINVHPCGRYYTDRINGLDLIEEYKEMKLEVGKFYKTNDGHKVFIAAEYDYLKESTRYIGIITEIDFIAKYFVNGAVCGSQNKSIKEEWVEPFIQDVKFFLNVNKIDNEFIVDPLNVYPTKEVADAWARPNRVGCFPLTGKVVL